MKLTERLSGKRKETRKAPMSRITAEEKNLSALAKLCGIQTSYLDNEGVERHATETTLRELLRVWGVEADSDAEVRASLAQMRAEETAHCIEPVVIMWDGEPITIPVNADRLEGWRIRMRGSDRPIAARGAASSEYTDTENLFTGTARRTGAGCELRIEHRKEGKKKGPPPYGYYEMEVEADGRTTQALLICAPSKAYAPEGSEKRSWGIFAPMYAVHTDRSWGGGDLSDWQHLIERAAHLGASVVSTLPLLASFNEPWKCEPSPYSPASRLFWNEFYVDVTRAPEFKSSRAVQKLINSRGFKSDLGELRLKAVVDYLEEGKLKRQALERMAAHLFESDSERRRSLEAFVAANPDLRQYAAFRAACERQERSWHSWPERMRSGELTTKDFKESTYQYYLYAQWLAQQQVDEVLAAGRERGVSLYLDLPLGVNPDGFDVWRERDSFVHGATVGAPPDSFFTKGQDWGFPPLHPQRIRENGYRYVIDYLRFQMQHTGMLRLDHVMALHRLWWVPRGGSAAEGAYVRYRAEELYAILCLESYRHKTTLIGENLGTVPPEVNRSMKRHGLRTMFVVQYEASEDPKEPLRDPARESVASLNTHDMPTWAGHWNGLDIADRRELGLLDATEVSGEAARRARVKHALARYLKRRKLAGDKAEDAKDALEALLKYLGGSKAELVLVSLEDLWLEESPQNTPGTCHERTNWSRKMRLKLDEIFSREEIVRLLRVLADGRGVKPPRGGVRVTS